MEINYGIFIFAMIFRGSLQDCPEEVSNDGISVTWHQTHAATNVESDPLCYRNETLVTRNCTGTTWTPSLEDMGPCLKVMKYFDLTSCPPGYHKISEQNSNYCFQIGESSQWNFPCFTSGGASVITDLSDTELEYLINFLISTNISRHFWLPASRQKLLNPVIWYTPGPNWGTRVQSSNNSLQIFTAFTKIHQNCLLLDTFNRVLTTSTCSNSHPSLCFYLSDLHYPAKCPEGYHAFRFKPGNGTCYGIENSDSPHGISFTGFLQSKCKKPMMNSENDLTRFIFKKIAELNNMSNDKWCWFGLRNFGNDYTEYSSTDTNGPVVANLQGIINNSGALSLLQSRALLPCMACEADLIYGETEFMFEYNEEQNKIFLTVYYPSGLWKYDDNDKGIQCFSDAKGFVRVVDVNTDPLMDVKFLRQEIDLGYIEKIVYVINLVTDSSAQYWCEGHTLNFSLITTDKIIVNPKGNQIHVFSLVIQYYVLQTDIQYIDNLTGLITNITEIFDARKVLLMEILDYVLDQMMILFHLHIDVNDSHDDKATDIQNTINRLKQRADEEFPKYNYTFVNMSSSVYCLPITTTNSAVSLDWELTLIGHITAPKQFCLQANGLPVKRQCKGSYKLGSTWDEVDGECDTNYKASETTTFLYTFVKRRMPVNYTSRFLIDGLNFVLGDIDIIIPADIYYLSMSLQQISDIAQENETIIDTGDIENIAWVMDKVMILDCKYLQLAQTLNSTNVILDSVNDIIEIIAQKNINETNKITSDAYQVAVKPQFVVQISYPDINNITGIAITRNLHSDNFKEMSIYPLYKNTTLDEVFSIENLEIATWIPNKMLKSLRANYNVTEESSSNSENLHVIITIFHNNAVFQELAINDNIINSRIVGISIPGFSSNLKYPVPIVFRKINNTPSETFCGYWDFNSEPSTHIPGIWRRQGCYMTKSLGDKTVCECYHLTHFGQLLTVSNNPDSDSFYVESQHTIALNIITLVGSFLSLLGIFGIWITALVFSNWRKKAGTKVLLQLSTAIALPLIFIIIFNLDTSIFIEYDGTYVVDEEMKLLCIILGASLHFTILASFMWMLITAVLQFIRYVRVLGVRRPSRFMVKFTLVGWGIPLIPVTIILAIDAENYIPGSSMFKKICYPNGYYFIGGVLLPICIILLTNVILFVLVLNAIARGPDQKMKSSDMDLVGAQLRVSIFLFFLLGLTWLFGIFSFSNHLIWSYLFCLTSTLQGFVLFLYFVICDPNTRNLWITLMKPQFSGSSSRNSVTSLSTGTGF